MPHAGKASAMTVRTGAPAIQKIAAAGIELGLVQQPAWVKFSTDIHILF